MRDRRNARRYDLSLPVTVRAPIDKEKACRAGKTRDISTRGVYFTIDDELSAGVELNLKIALPVEVTTHGSEVCINATGKVVRVDKRSGNGNQRIDVAAVFEMHEIVRNDGAFQP